MSGRRATLRGVTFDLWNTVLREEGDALVPSRLDALQRALATRGVMIDIERAARAHAAAFAQYQAAWMANQQFVVSDAAEMISQALGIESDLAPVVLQALIDGGRHADIRACDGIHSCLEKLRAAGMKTAIVCDIGLTPSAAVHDVLEAQGLHMSFDAHAFSDVVGTYKPDPAIFAYVLARMGDLIPEQVAHVGDRRRTDVQGAIAAGLTAVRYRKVFDDDDDSLPEASIVIDELEDLPDALGLDLA